VGFVILGERIRKDWVMLDQMPFFLGLNLPDVLLLITNPIFSVSTPNIKSLFCVFSVYILY
jgi:hypothetical protein